MKDKLNIGAAYIVHFDAVDKIGKTICASFMRDMVSIQSSLLIKEKIFLILEKLCESQDYITYKILVDEKYYNFYFAKSEFGMFTKVI